MVEGHAPRASDRPTPDDRQARTPIERVTVVRRSAGGGRRLLLRGQAAAALALVMMCGFSASSQTPAEPVAVQPSFRVAVMGELDPEFGRRVSRYHELRVNLEARLPPQVVTEDARQIRAGELALARLIRIARTDAHEGDIFTAASGAQLRQGLLLVMTPQTWAAIMDDNPGTFSHRINGNYPRAKTLSTMPYSILAQLPELPEGIEYRFLGRDLILHDTHANVILDRLRYAIRCDGCDS